MSSILSMSDSIMWFPVLGVIVSLSLFVSVVNVSVVVRFVH